MFHREAAVSVEVLGVEKGLTTPQYYACSLLIFYLLLMGLPYGSLLCREDQSLSALLHAKGCSCIKQHGGEFLALLCGQLASMAVLLTAVWIAGKAWDLSSLSVLLPEGGTFPVGALCLALLLTTAFHTVVYGLCNGVISGILLHFFLSLGLSYLSGCFYPLYAFPPKIQTVAEFLPVCVLRNYLAGLYTGEALWYRGLLVFAYGLGFFALGWLGKKRRLSRYTGG